MQKDESGYDVLESPAVTRASLVWRQFARLQRIRVPFWRSMLVLGSTLVLLVLLDLHPALFENAWIFAWPCFFLAVVLEALYIIFSMYQDMDDTPAHVLLHGMSGVARIFDIWIAWTLCLCNTLMIFYLTGSHSVHFTGLEHVTPDSSTNLDAWSYFFCFSFGLNSGAGLILLQPATFATRIIIPCLSMFTFLTMCLLIYTCVAETIANRAKPVRDK